MYKQIILNSSYGINLKKLFSRVTGKFRNQDILFWITNQIPLKYVDFGS